MVVGVNYFYCNKRQEGMLDSLLSFMVPLTGLEPVRYFYRGILSQSEHSHFERSLAKIDGFPYKKRQNLMDNTLDKRNYFLLNARKMREYL